MNKVKQIKLFNPGILYPVILTLSIAILWCWVCNRMTLAAWRVPVNYNGDSWFLLGSSKAYLDGDIHLILQKNVAHLGAPFIANWNDYPVTEDLIVASIGWLGRLVGLFMSSNIVLLLAHISAGLSFWWVGTKLKYKYPFIFTGAVLFAFSNYIFVRGLPHLTLSFYWHIPLILLVSWWSMSKNQIKTGNSKWWISVFIAFACGIQNPYYTGMFLQLLFFATLVHLSRKQWKMAGNPIIFGTIAVAGFVLMNADTFVYQAINGKNTECVVRNLAGLELYGLKMPELFLPAWHRWHALARFAQNRYFSCAMIRGEMGSPYLGMIGIAGFLWLLWIGLWRLMRGIPQKISTEFYQVIWILFYSIIGGVNLLIGSLGFQLFRATNRYSIFILTISLLFLVKQLSRHCPRRFVVLTALALLFIGLWDQLPPQTPEAAIAQVAHSVRSDRDFTRQLELNLPPGGMVFQLPVMDFPEVPSLLGVEDYEHFRPYFFSKNLRYSYGTDKGRSAATWQRDVLKLRPENMIAKLEEYGFDAIYINRKGYVDKGNKLINALKATGEPIIAESDMGDLIAFRLSPFVHPKRPWLGINFDDGWSGDEYNHRWAIGRKAVINLDNNSGKIKTIIINFSLSTLIPRNVNVLFNGRVIDVFHMIPGKNNKINGLKCSLGIGHNSLRFVSDTEPRRPGNGDPRKLSFDISKLNIKEKSETAERLLYGM